MQPLDGKTSISIRRTPKPEGLSITWKDGLPDDPLERAQIEQILITSDLTSQYSAIKRLNDGDDDAAQEEMDRINEEKTQQMLGEAAMGGGAVPTGDELGQSAAELAKMRAQRGSQGQGDANSGQRTEGQ